MLGVLTKLTRWFLFPRMHGCWLSKAQDISPQTGLILQHGDRWQIGPWGPLDRRKGTRNAVLEEGGRGVQGAGLAPSSLSNGPKEAVLFTRGSCRSSSGSRKAPPPPPRSFPPPAPPPPPQLLPPSSPAHKGRERGSDSLLSPRKCYEAHPGCWSPHEDYRHKATLTRGLRIP